MQLMELNGTFMQSSSFIFVVMASKTLQVMKNVKILTFAGDWGELLGEVCVYRL